MTLGDFEDVKVIGLTIGAIKEYKAYTINEFLQLPHFARAKAVADPAEALKAYRAANDKRSKSITITFPLHYIILTNHFYYIAVTQPLPLHY